MDHPKLVVSDFMENSQVDAGWDGVLLTRKVTLAHWDFQKKIVSINNLNVFWSNQMIFVRLVYCSSLLGVPGVVKAVFVCQSIPRLGVCS